MHILLGIALGVALPILAFSVWLILWWDTAEPTFNGLLAKRAADREYRRTHRIITDGHYWVIPAIGLGAFLTVWVLSH